MKSNYPLKIILLAIFTFLSGNSFCQSPVGYLGIEQGLSNNSVRYIYQDKKGFMWFCTYDGLNRYDGYGFKVFRNNINDSNSLVHNVTISVTEDQKNNLWIATRQGASIYNPLSGKFTTLSYLSKQNRQVIKVYDVVKDVKVDAKNNAFIGCEGPGLLFASNGASTATQIPFKSGSSETTHYGVHSIRIDNNGRVWVLVQTKGLCLLDYKTMKLVLVDSTLPLASCFEIDKHGIWMGAVGGIYYYDMGTNTTVKVLDALKDKMTSSVIVSLALDKNNLWIGTNGGGVNIYDIASKQLSYFHGKNGKSLLSSDAIYSIYIDKESRKWLGTLRGGVNIIDPKKDRFTTIAKDPTSANSLPTNFIYSFFEAPDSTIWIGTDGMGLTRWNRKTNSFTPLFHNSIDSGSIAGNAIACIKADFKGDIWIASMGGVGRFNIDLNKYEHFKCINPVSKAENKSCNVVLEDRHKTIWAATLRQGSLYGALYRFNRTTNQFDAFDTQLSDLFTMFEDKNGTLWGGNLSQLVKIDVVNKQHLFYNIGPTVRAFFEDEKGNFWIGTEGGGLLLFDRKTGKVIKRYTTADGLPNNAVLTIITDKSGNLWMSTYNGLSKFSIDKRTFTNYYQSDGLQSNEFHYDAALALRSGELLFGGIKGFNVFDPGRITLFNTVPKLVFTGLTINNKPIEEDNSFITKSSDQILEIKLPYNEAIVSIDFTALEYSSPHQISYAYYLQGWDRGWNYTNTRNANYTHLEEGSYTFKVKSTNAKGAWNTKEISLKIIVLPPWYRSWWAGLFYLTVVITAIILYNKYKARQVRLQYEVKLAHLETKQERVINEKKLSFFTNISHEFRTPLTLIINPIREMMRRKSLENQENDLGTVYRNARRMLSLVDQLLLFRKAESGADKMRVTNINFYILCYDVYLCFIQEAAAKKIEYTFLGENRSLKLYADREKIEIILYNLISNALKYTPDGGKISLEIREEDTWVQVLVTDNGTGISTSLGEDVFEKFYQSDKKAVRKNKGFGIGLYLVKLFTLAHKGEISYNSTPGAGTVFNLRLLKGTGHFEPAVVISDEEDSPVAGEMDIPEEEFFTGEGSREEDKQIETLVSDQQTILIVDDDPDLRKYMVGLFKEKFTVFDCATGEKALKLAKEFVPDIIISDIKMQGLSGIDLCRAIKEDATLKHIPVILITGTSSEDIKLEGYKEGADDYITKPFDDQLLMTRVANILKNRNNLQQYFYNEITLNQHNIKISEQYKAFLETCIAIVQDHLEDESFNVNVLVSQVGMSRSVVYRKIKAISGQSPNGFIRFIRLRQAATLMINTNKNVNEVAASVGIYDAKHFREHFNKLFGMNPSEYIKKYRKLFAGKFNVNKEGMQQTDLSDDD